MTLPYCTVVEIILLPHAQIFDCMGKICTKTAVLKGFAIVCLCSEFKERVSEHVEISHEVFKR